MNIIADICVVPVGAEASVSEYVAECVRIFDDANLVTKTHAYGTNVEGPWERVFDALKTCHQRIHEMGAPRISTTVRVGTRTDKVQTLDDKILSVARKVNRVATDDRQQFLVPEATSSPWMEVRDSSIHNRGAHATKFIPEGTKIIEYVGRKIDKDEADRIYERSLEEHKKDPSKGSVYLFVLDDDWDIDGDVEWNTAKVLNHSCDPNCETDIVDGRVWIIAARDIESGEELTYDYGYDYENWEDHPCLCGASTCIGYIVSLEDHQKLRREMRDKDLTPPGRWWVEEDKRIAEREAKGSGDKDSKRRRRRKKARS